MIEPTLNSSDQNSLGDLEQLLDKRREHREQAAIRIYESLEQIAHVISSGVGYCEGFRLGDLGLNLYDALVHLERGGVAIPRLPTQQEMDR